MIPIGQATTEALLIYVDEPPSSTAGVQGFRPHRLRHTAAHRWLAAGGSESGLMAIAGWTRTDMLVRYTRARASERAADEARRLNLGDLFVRS